jgi:glycosyltransferase involved in cell wall biosynthesis
VWVERAWTAAMAREAGFRRFVTDLDALEMESMAREIGRRGFYWSKGAHYLEYLKVRRYERRLAGQHGPVVVCKEEDRTPFGQRARNVFVVPNGVPPLPLADAQRSQPGRMLFVGDMQYEPNVDAVLYFKSTMLPRIQAACPSAHLVVVGRGHSNAVARAADGRSVVYAGEVADLGPSFDDASLFVVPMRGGGGTRLKVLEALGRGMAVVSTPVGAEGLALEQGRDLWIHDDPTAFADHCATLLLDPILRCQLGCSGRKAVSSRYGWEHAVNVADHALGQLASHAP